MFCRPDLDRATWAIQWGVPAGAYRRGRIGYASSGRKVFDHLANVTDDATGPARILLFLLMNWQDALWAAGRVSVGLPSWRF
jgi:hypothetical protein